MKIDMSLREIIAETEARYSKRQGDRHQHQRKLEAGEFLQADNPDRVKSRLQRLGVERATAEAYVEGLAVPLPAPAAPTLERIFFKSDLMQINYLERGMLAGHAIGRIWIRAANGQLTGYATGFMVSPQLLLTNHHVLPNREAATHSRVEFNYQEGLDGQPLTPVICTFNPESLFIADKSLDYALVAVEPLPEANRFGWHRLIEDEGKVIIGEYVSIIQHPGGEPKQVALRENQLVDVLPEFLHYQTDTAVGSSGSPVFNDQWEVVALHHSGVPQRDRQGRILSTDGTVWTDDQGEQKIAWLANEGTRISRIIHHIKHQRLSGTPKTLRNNLFEAIPDSIPLSGTQSMSTADPESIYPIQPSPLLTHPTSVSSTTPSVASDGTVTWTIPIQVSVRIGQPVMHLTPSPPPSPVPSHSEPLQTPHQTGDRLEDALAELNQARQRPYYDEEQDEQARHSYYGNLPDRLPALSAEAAYRAVSERLRTTHTHRPSYKPSRQLYPWVDLHPDLKLRSIYSGEAFEPEVLIREDFRIDQLRSLRIQELQLQESDLSPEQYNRELEWLEASLPYNCEHVVPQSWFNKAEPMRGDLHHLFACEVACNSFRSNYPYFDFDQFQERDSIRDRCGKLSSSRFEPIKGKGIVARATLYFLLRYAGKIAKSETKYTRDRLETLIDWHNSYPPNDYEQHRNAAIFEKQGNRNPLIDFPEWADQLDFSLGLS